MSASREPCTCTHGAAPASGIGHGGGCGGCGSSTCPCLLGWGAVQGHLVTGGGPAVLGKAMRADAGHYRDPEDLPHVHKKRGDAAEAFAAWAARGETHAAVAGAWARPLFCGGWGESGGWDTDVFNIQTTSLFVDLRFPRARPDVRERSGLRDLTLEELRALSRQHCFAGYTRVEERPTPAPGAAANLVATRHHAVDWNYHPKFPRPRPNKWRIELPAADQTGCGAAPVAEDGPVAQSFKEWSHGLDAYGVPVYLERWQRLSNSAKGFLALQSSLGILCVAGDHFGLAIDRAVLPAFDGAKAGGCANLIDHAFASGDRAAMEQFLDMEGSYGRVVTRTSGGASWRIERSTHPWLEGTPLLSPGDAVVQFGDAGLPVSVRWRGEAWKVVECSFSPRELGAMFGPGARARL